MAGPGLKTGDSDLFAHAGLAFGGEELEAYAEVPIEVEQVLDTAKQMTGLDDWGYDDSFRVGLEVLVDAIEQMEPTPRHRHSFRRQIVHLLNQRLRMRDDEVRDPSVVEQAIERPLIILGLPRTGTTLAHELLALDPNARAPLNWEYAQPWPAPESRTFDTDSRIERVNRSWAAQRAASPELAHMLPTSATMPSECNDSMMFHFAGPNFWAWMRVPAHRRWSAEKSAPGLYRTHRRVLQQLQWKGPEGRWTLKSPAFVGDITDLLDTYPDACIVWTHRDPARTIASLSSLVASLQYALLGERPDPIELAEGARELWVAALKRGVAARKDPRAAAAIIDVPYAQLTADHSGTVERIHERFGFEFSDEHRAAIERLETEQPASQYARHSYTIDEYGLDVDQLRDELFDYYEECWEFVAS